MMSMITLGIIFLLIGMISNHHSLLGNANLHFIIAAIITSYEGLTYLITILPKIPVFILVIVYSYLLGTFLQKILRLIPILGIGTIFKKIGG